MISSFREAPRNRLPQQDPGQAPQGEQTAALDHGSKSDLAF